MNGATIIACLTPPGRGAIATLAVRGPQAWPITRELFRRKTKSQSDPLPEIPVPDKFWLGWLGEAAEGGADQVVLLVRQATPSVHLELHCHGGPEVVRLLQEQYQSRGVDVVTWQEFEGAVAPAWQVAALEVLMHAPTVRTAAIALDQWHGAFQRSIEECSAAWRSGEREKASNTLRRLHDLAAVGRHLTQPWRVVLAGAPNVGKSSLSNALAGFARSIVAPTPGTTRDVVTTGIALDGWPMELADTAGLRVAGDALEQTGITRARAAVQAAELCVWVVDGAAEPVLPATDAASVLLVINKTDLAPAWDWNRLPAALHVSAETAAGLPLLCQRIVERLVPAPPGPGEAVPHSEGQFAALAAIVAALKAGNDQEVTKGLADL